MTESQPPLVAIIVPCHNVAHKLNIAGGLKEISDPRVEIWFINDASTDDTQAALERAADRMKVRANVISGNFRGPGGARNAGIRATNAKYLWFVDADDLIFPGPVLEILAELEDASWDVVAFPTKISAFSRYSGQVIRSEFGIGTAHQRFLASGKFIGNLVSRKFLLKNSIFYPEEVLIHEDSAFFTKVACQVESWKAYDELVYEYLLNPDSILTKKPPSRYHSSWFSLHDIVTFARTHVAPEEHAELFTNAVNRAFWSSWVYFVSHRDAQGLLRFMPKAVAALRQMGVLKHVGLFLQSGSRRERVVKSALFLWALPMSYLVQDGLRSIKREYSWDRR